MEIYFDFVQTIGIAVIFLIIGNLLVEKIDILKKSSIPAAVFGGLLFALVNMLGYISGIGYIVFDGYPSTFFMIFYFTTIGLNVSFRLLKNVGSLAIRVILFSALFCVIQNTLGVILSNFVDFPPILGLMLSSAPMTGGHGTVAAIAPTIENLGFTQALTVGQTAATIGIIVGSFFAAPLGDRLIKKYNLADPDKIEAARKFQEGDETAINETNSETEGQEKRTKTRAEAIYSIILVILLCMFFGSFVTQAVNNFAGNFIEGVSFPAVLGPMLIGVIFRNISDSLTEPIVDEWGLSVLADVSLDLFLSISITGLQLWQLFDIALQMAIIIAVIVIVTIIFNYFVTFRFMGGDYDAAITTTGFIGFTTGASPNALASMGSLGRKYYPSQRATLAISLNSGLFLDFNNIMILYAFIAFLS